MTPVHCRRWLLCWVAVVTTALAASASVRDPVPIPTLVVAFTPGMFAGVQVNDAKAAMDVWARTVASSHGLDLTTSVEIYDNVEALGQAMDAGRAHVVVLSVGEYRRLRRPQFGSIMLGARRGRHQEEFLLLVRAGRFQRVPDLRGRTLTTLEGTGHDMSLAWIDSVLLGEGLASAREYFGTVTSVSKPARAVLPVFFEQRDACLTTRYGFELMVELNPQLGTGLTVVASSPPMVHSLVVFDRRFSPANRDRVVMSLLALHESPRGQQVLSLFGLDRLVEGTPADLAPALELLARVDRLRSTKGQP